MEVVGIIIVVICWIALAKFNKFHKVETGVDMPSRAAMARIRRNGRKMGISEAEAYASWVKRKRQLASGPRRRKL